MSNKKGMTVESPIGRLSIDTAGSPVAAAKMDPAQAYVDVPELLRRFIDESSTDAWEQIKERIDYIYANLDHALGRLNEETGFKEKVKQQVKEGKKLLFKPNLVNPMAIDRLTHGEGLGNTACTSWPFVAALMRWFHDNLDITYYEMTVGEAASATSVMAGVLSMMSGNAVDITTEAVIEGKCGDLYGGWGFYFVRKYLADAHDPSHTDNPMNGYDESVSGEYLPPGRAGNRLMVYDLNRIQDIRSKGRDIPVPDGANYSEITLHKAIIGGDPADPEDIRDYPGCVLVNVPKLKMHAIDLLTNAIKNLGIGLYPMQVANDDDPKSTRWKYAFPFKQYPGMKTEIPHAVWISRMDDDSGLPVRNEKGEYIVTKTAGMSGTQADVIKATENQRVFMLHVVDAIETTNIDHTGMGMGQKVAEGYAFASLDPVALDLFCARYVLKTLPLQEARRLQKEKSLGTDFLQKVPVAKSDGKNIVTEEGIDSPLLRYNLYKYVESRGLGQQRYYVTGWDAVEKAPLASVEGHLGRIDDGARFCELITSSLYYASMCILWDLQKTVLSYAKASDSLTGSSYYQELLNAFDENGDGVIDYDESGKNGFWASAIRLSANNMPLMMTADTQERLRGQFLSGAMMLKYTDENWNPQGHNFLKQSRQMSAPVVALMMSQIDMESPDILFPDITWGKGKWPSLQLAGYVSTGSSIYGMGFPMGVGLLSLYGYAFQYADITLNGGGYTGGLGQDSEPEAANNYIKAVADGATPLNFTLYIPIGYGSSVGISIPNVEETDDPEKILTAHFNGGQEAW